ncbi:MAG: ROK family protein [Candidatus Omnitrophica bacterium]|nr:ROK family protein [Candidatus Omnitrophota bacterium]
MNKYIIGIDVGGTNVKLGIVSPKGKITARHNFSTKKYSQNKTQLINALVSNIEALLAEHNIPKKDIGAIGMGLPGLIDPIKGLVHYLPNIPGWKNVPLKKILQDKLGLPIYMDNDVKVITLAEWKYGAGVGYENFMCITLGTGVGGGLVFNNKMYRGEGYVAGEIGHMPLYDKTLEGLVGNKVLQQRAAKIFKNKDISLEEVYRLADLGNDRAKEFWQETGNYIGTTLAGVINLLNLRLIIIGGGVSNNFKFLSPAIKSTIDEKCMKVQAKMVKVVRCKLHDDAGIIGAQILVKDPTIEA